MDDCLKCKGRLQVITSTETEIQFGCLNSQCELKGVIQGSEVIPVEETKQTNDGS